MPNPIWLTNAIAEFHSVNKAYAMLHTRESVLGELVKRMTAEQLGEYVKQTKDTTGNMTCKFCETSGVEENEIQLMLTTSGAREPVCSGCYDRYDEEDAYREAQYLQDEQEGEAI